VQVQVRPPVRYIYQCWAILCGMPGVL
jgi:hypothetical protein